MSDTSNSPLLIYFCASIRGETLNKSIAREIVQHIQQYGTVLTEHIIAEQCELSTTTNTTIYNRDMNWLKSSSIVIADCTAISIGVGYELGIAETLLKPVLVLYNTANNSRSLSAMISGNSYFNICYYNSNDNDNLDTVKNTITEFIKLHSTHK